VKFAKVQSVGNDFVLIEHQDGLDYPTLATQVCPRHFGIGSDGLLVITPGEELGLRMFNPDGTEDFCGNGLRCAAVYARSKGFVSDESFAFHQLGRIIPTRFDEDDVLTKLDPGTYDPALVPLASNEEMLESPIEVAGRRFVGHAVSTGSTHLVIPVEDLPGDDEFFEVSPLLEHHPLFPARTSVMWMKRVDIGHIRLRIWERGAGETMGCGTGSTAAAIVYVRRTQFSGNVRVENPGGTLIVKLKEWDDRPVIRGQATIVYEGVIDA